MIPIVSDQPYTFVPPRFSRFWYRVMRRILPVAKDRRPEIYARIWQRAW